MLGRLCKLVSAISSVSILLMLLCGWMDLFLPSLLKDSNHNHKYKHCNMSSILCGGDESWNNLTKAQAGEMFYRRIQNFKYKCKKRARFGRRGDGGYEVCLDPGIKPRKVKCLVYSFGIRNEWSFDESVRRKLGCVVHSFDPSMKMEDHEHQPGIYFHNVGLWGTDMTHSNGWKLLRFSTLIKQLKHEKAIIDILKIDIEGAEWPAIRDMLLNGDLSNIKQLILEIHAPKFRGDYAYKEEGAGSLTVPDLAEMYNYYSSLEMAGFKLYWMRDNNNCCGRFYEIVEAFVRGKERKFCCFETFLINTRFIK